MDRIDKSVVRAHSSVIIKRWVKQEPAPPAALPAEPGAVPVDAAAPVEMQAPAANLEELARRHAEKIVNNAQDQADLLLEQAANEAEQLRKDAQQQGLTEGKLEAERQQQLLAKELNSQFSSFLEELRAREDLRDGEMEKSILLLSLEIAEKILAVKLEKDRELFIGMIREAMQRLNAKEKFSVHVNQREYDRFFAEGSGWLQESMQSAPFSAVADAAVAPGGLLLVSMEGSVRAGVDTQLANIKDALLSHEDDADDPL